jgi:acetyltransferase-like isoleucine patch superfamily enzyme
MRDIKIDKTANIKYLKVALLGDHIAIGHCVYISTQIHLQDYVHISAFVSVIGGKYSLLKMGNFTNLACGVRIICNSDDFAESLGGPLIPKEYAVTINKPVILEGFNMIGTNSIIMPGVTMAIGSSCIANSIITKDTEEWTLYGGNGIALCLRNKVKILNDAKKLGYGL